MQSKTSCFNKTLFRKHVTRFWPIWAAYFCAWLLILPLGMLGAREHIALDPMFVRQSVLDSVASGGVVLSLIFAALAAMGVWSFLYSSRSASGAACLPVTRTAQFNSAALAGLVPLLCVHVVIFLLTLLAEVSLGALHLPSLWTWLGATTLVLLFFYGFATFCAMLTGNIIVLPAVYLVLNFTAAGFVMLLGALAQWFLYGVTGASSAGIAAVLEYLSPVIPMLRLIGTSATWVEDPVTGAIRVTEVAFRGWGVAAIYGAVGLLLLVAAWALLRRRRMESAGDVVAVQPLKPVFRWCMGIGGGLCFANMMLFVFRLSGDTQASVFALTAVYLVVGAFIGWFAAEMLIRRSFRAFSRGMRGWAGWALCCAVLLLGLAATEFDLFGYERRQPKPEQIEAVVIHANESAYLETPEGVAAALELHRGIIANKARQDQCGERCFFSEDDADSTVSLQVDYILRSGRNVSRRYLLPHTAGAQDDAAAVQALLNCPEAVQARKKTPVPFTEDNVRFGSVNAVMTARECAAAAGYDDPADYILRELGGFSPQEVAGMNDALRAEQVRTTLEQYGWQYGGTYGDMYAEKAAPFVGPETLPLPENISDWDKIWLEYTLELSAPEAWELYSTCLLPDFADGALGRVWILTEEPDYAETACLGGIEIVAEHAPQENLPTTLPADYGPVPATADGYARFTVAPTVDASRTAAFLAQRGIRLHTRAEVGFAAGE